MYRLARLAYVILNVFGEALRGPEHQVMDELQKGRRFTDLEILFIYIVDKASLLQNSFQLVQIVVNLSNIMNVPRNSNPWLI